MANPRRVFKFVTAGDQAAQTFLSQENRVRNSDAVGNNILLLKMANFDINALSEVAQRAVAVIAEATGITASMIVQTLCAHFDANGAARNVETGGIIVPFADDLITNDDYEGRVSTTEDGATAFIDCTSVMKAISDAAKAQYDTVARSASGSKLYMRIFSNAAYVTFFSGNTTAGALKSKRKIAMKTNLARNLDFCLASMSFPDLMKVTRADAVRYLRIMASYMKRQRTNHNKNDVQGKVVNIKDIFLSLSERLMISHPEVGTLDGTFVETIWSTPDLANSDFADGGSEFYFGDAVRSLAAQLRLLNLDPAA